MVISKPQIENKEKGLGNLLLLGFGALATMVLMFLAWSHFWMLNGAIIAPATIQAETFSKRIQHREGGNVLKILVKDGDEVKVGQSLIILDPTEAQSQVDIYAGLIDELSVKRARLEAQREFSDQLHLPLELSARAKENTLRKIVEGQSKLLKSTIAVEREKLSQLNGQIKQIHEQIKGLKAQGSANQTQLVLVEKEYQTLKPLQKKGFVTNTRMMSIEREIARLSGVLGEIQANTAAASEKITEINVQGLQTKETVRTQALSELRDTESRLAELLGQRTATESRLKHMTIKAPIDGIIYQMAVHTEGGVISPGEQVMMILPSSDSLVLQAAVSPTDIDNLYVGQKADLVFQAFNSQTMKKLIAEVTHVAADTSKPDPAKGETQPYYAIRMQIDPSELAKLEGKKLKPGMIAEAFIQTEARTPFYYLLKPLLQQWRRAMREQ